MRNLSQINEGLRLFDATAFHYEISDRRIATDNSTSGKSTFQRYSNSGNLDLEFHFQVSIVHYRRRQQTDIQYGLSDPLIAVSVIGDLNIFQRV